MPTKARTERELQDEIARYLWITQELRILARLHPQLEPPGGLWTERECADWRLRLAAERHGKR